MRSGSVIMYGERYPLSNCMPSVNSSSRPNVWPSSTFTTPSLPTFSIASAMTSPISRSRETTVPTRDVLLARDLLDCALPSSSTIASMAFSMPRLSPIGFAPAATFFRPPRGRWPGRVTVAVVAVAGDVVRRGRRLADELGTLVLERPRPRSRGRW